MLDLATMLKLCTHRHLQTLQSKAELTNKDFVVFYPVLNLHYTVQNTKCKTKGIEKLAWLAI